MADLYELTCTVRSEVTDFQNILRQKGTAGDILSNPYIIGINTGCNSIDFLMEQLGTFAQLDTMQKGRRQLDANTSHLGATLELALSYLSLNLFVLKACATITDGREQKSRFWSKKLKYVWDEEILEQMDVRICEVYNVLLLLLNAVIHPDDPISYVAAVLEKQAPMISEMVHHGHAFRQSTILTSGFVYTEEIRLLTNAAYDRAWILFTYAKFSKTPLPLANDGEASVSKVVQDASKVAPIPRTTAASVPEASTTSIPEDSATSLSKISTTLAPEDSTASILIDPVASTSAKPQPVSLVATSQTSTDVIDPTMKQVEQALLDTSISFKDVPSYKAPVTSVSTPQSAPPQPQPIEVLTRVSNEKMDKALVEAAAKGHTAMIKMLIAKGGNVNFGPNPEKDPPLYMAAINGKIETLDVICDAILLQDPLGVHRSFGNDEREGYNLLDCVCALLHDANEMVDHLITHRGFDINQPGNLGKRPLHYAATANNPKLIEHLIVKYKVDVHAVDNEKSTALHTASYKGYVESINMLLDHGADINAWNTEDDQPIHCAALGNHTAAAEVLLNRGAHIEDTDNGERPLVPIFCVIKSKQTETLNLLLARGANPTITGTTGNQPIHWVGSLGTPAQLHILLTCPSVSIHTVTNETTLIWNPFHYACQIGNLEVMKSLVALGADLNLRDKESTSPLYLCAAAGRSECVDYLLSVNPLLAQEQPGNPEEFPLLHMVASGGHLEIMTSLLKAGANPRIWNITQSPLYLPIHYAAQGRFLALTLLLLDAYPASLELPCTVSESHLTVLGVAASANAIDVMIALAERGADVECVAAPKKDPTDPDDPNAKILLPTIHVAARSDCPDIIHLLAKAGANIEVIHDDNTPLIHAVRSSNVASIRALLEAGANIEGTDANGYHSHAIHYAAGMENSAQLVALVERGADIEARMDKGWRPLHLAAKSGCLDCVRYLVGKGADQDALDGEGKSALDLAVGEGFVECVEILI